MLIEGKVILITGGSSGIGAATAKMLAAAGAKVVLGARRVDRLEVLAGEIAEAGGQVRYMSLDVTDLEQMKAFVVFAQKEFGHVDVIVNNAGIMPVAPLRHLAVDKWNDAIDVNIRGVLHGMAAVLPSMEARGSGHIVNVASTAGLTSSPTAAVYCATKSAVRVISDSFRQETKNIRMTVISPGLTESELAESIPDEVTREKMKTFRQNAIPAGAIAAAIAFAIGQPDNVDVSEMVVRPTAS